MDTNTRRVRLKRRRGAQVIDIPPEMAPSRDGALPRWRPPEMALSRDDVNLRREGDRLIIEPLAPRSLLELLATLEPIADDVAPALDSPAD